MLAAAAIAAASVLVATGSGIGDVWVVVALAVVAAIAERGSVQLSPVVEESISLLPTLFAAVLFGPLASMAVAGASMAGDIRRGRRLPMAGLRWVIYTCTRSLGGAATGFAAAAVASAHVSGFGRIAIATCVAALASQILDTIFASLTLAVRGGNVRELLATLIPVNMMSVPLYSPVVAVLAFAYSNVSPWTLALFFAPALAAQRLFAMYQEQRRLATDLANANDRLESANLSFATALVATLDARDGYTAGHSAAVAIYARDIATRMALSSDEQQLAHLCGLVHDIGKVGLPAGLLEKTGPLTLEERRLMQEHPAIGERILRKVETYAEIASVVRHHHERVDGNGYPDGVSGDQIPLLARIIAVADSYNAMTSDRPYRDAMPSRVARLRLAQAVESQFDTTVVAAFEAVLAGATEEYRLGTGGDFTLSTQSSQADAFTAVA